MKKLAIWGCALATLFIVNSCTQDELVPAPEQAAVETEDQPTTRGIKNQSYHSLGVSYDVNDGFLNDKGTRYPVVDIDAYIANGPDDDPIDEDITTRGYHEFYSGANAEDFTKEVQTKTTAGVGISDGIIKNWLPVGNIKYSNDLNTKNSYSTKYSYSRADVVKEVKHISLDATPEMLQPYLHYGFTRDINSMTPDAFVKKYGTHILLDITIGGKLQFDYRSQIVETESMVDKKTAVEAGAKFSISGIGADINGSYSNQTIITQNRKNAVWELKVEYMGGTQSGLSQQFNSEGQPVTSMNYSAWEASVTEANAGIIDINWAHTYPIYDFIADPVKKQQIKTAVENYINNETISVVEVKPLYRLHNSRDYSNTFFSTSWNEVQYLIAVDNYYLDYGAVAFPQHYIQGYVFKDYQPGMVPLIRLFKQSIKNSFFTTSRDEADHYILYHGYSFDMAQTSFYLGWVYPYPGNPGLEFTPLYRLYSGNNTWMTTSYVEALYYMNAWDYVWDYGETHYIQGYMLPY